MDNGSYWHGYVMARHRVDLIIGTALMVLALISALTGVTIEKYRGMVFRSDDPKAFWQDIATFWVLGLVFLGLYLYTAN